MMHEKSEEGEAPQGAIFTAGTVEADDVGLRGAWIAAAQQIAGTEQEVATWLTLRRSVGCKAADELRPGFLYLGRREALAFIAAAVVGILTYGPSFAHWVQASGGDPCALAEFEKVYLGSWPSVEQFTEYLLKEREQDDGAEAEPAEEPPEEAALDAAQWAADLQRRGEIRVVDDPAGGVWIFRGW
jgi:hypothetical protein